MRLLANITSRVSLRAIDYNVLCVSTSTSPHNAQEHTVQTIHLYTHRAQAQSSRELKRHMYLTTLQWNNKKSERIVYTHISAK